MGRVPAAPPSNDSLPASLRRWAATARPSPSGEALELDGHGIPLALDDLERHAGDGELPGTFPYTRGRTRKGYLDELWVMGLYSGYGTPRQTKERFRTLLVQGQTGLSVALDLPTQMGIDSDDPRAQGEVGRTGVPLDTVDDFIELFDGLPLERLRQARTTANAIGPMFAAMVIVAMEELGISPEAFRLMLQNDPLKEYSARGTFIFPPRAGVKLAVDLIEYTSASLPHWEPIEFCGYHIRDAGSTLVQEVALATANGIAYLDEAQRRGVDIDRLAHTLYVFLSAGIDIFEEAAKFRATRRLWARILVERYGVRPENAAINLFGYTLGGALTAQEPLNNIVRVTCEALSAVLGGTQTLATSSYDEALGLPSPEAAHVALRTQQILAYEAGAASVPDPLGGSFYVEELTDRIEAAAMLSVADVLDQGGSVALLDAGEVVRDLADAAFRLHQEIESGERVLVGVNRFVENDRGPGHGGFRRPLRVDPSSEAEQVERLQAVKSRRDRGEVESTLAALTAAADRGENVMEPLIAATRARATLGEITAALAAVFGRHDPTSSPPW